MSLHAIPIIAQMIPWLSKTFGCLFLLEVN